jgi:hypothetical protein
MALQFVTLNEIKGWIGIELVNTEHDTVLTLIGEAIEQSVLNYTEAQFALQTVVGELVDGNQSDVITPRNAPIHSIQGLYFGSESDGTGGDLVDPADYHVGEDAITMRHIGSPRGRYMVRIDYKWGYDGVPSDVKLAILQASEAEFRRKGRKSIGLAGRSKKDESERFSGGDSSAWDTKTGLPVEVVSKLRPYKRFEFPTQPMATRNA